MDGVHRFAMALFAAPADAPSCRRGTLATRPDGSGVGDAVARLRGASHDSGDCPRVERLFLMMRRPPRSTLCPYDALPIQFLARQPTVAALDRVCLVDRRAGT